MLNSIFKLFFPSLVKEPKRARDSDGRLVGDDKKTPTFNEAWVGGKAPAKKKAAPKRAASKKAAPKKRGRPPKVPVVASTPDLDGA